MMFSRSGRMVILMAKNMTKKDLAELAIRLFANIDQSDQWDNYSMTEECIKHVDKKFLLHLIDDLRTSVKSNVEYGGKYLVDDDEEVERILREAGKILGEDDEL